MAGRKQHNLVKGALCGLVAGVVGSALMDVYWLIVQGVLGARPEQEHKGPGSGQIKQAHATQVLADMVSEVLAGKPVPREDRPLTGIAVHYATGLLCGALYGAVAARRPRTGIVAGVLYGAGIWLFFDEIALRALNISPDVEKVPPREHLQALGAHLAYGAGVGLVTRLLLR